jgi:hypothetical protein
MDPLYNKTGQVHAWLQADVARIVGLHGEHLAFVEGKSVYDWHGNHIGWWADGHMRDAHGAVVVWLATAANLGVIRPPVRARPSRPELLAVPARPVRSARPARPVRALRWSSQMPF